MEAGTATFWESSTWRILRKIVVALLGGGVASLITSGTHQPGIWVLTMSLFVGGVTLIVQFLIEVDANLHETARVQRAAANDLPALVRGEFSKISRATELFGRVESSELRADAITELVQYAAMADFQPGSLTAGVMNLQLDTARHFFRQLT